MSPMRFSLLLLTFVLAVRAESMDCVPMWVSVSGAEFFGRADLVFCGRWDGDRDGNGVFRAEGVVRGHAEIGGTYSPEVHPCNLLDNGRLYIVARWCGKGACNRIVWHDEGQFRRLLRFHENEHHETLESLMDRMIRWQAGGESNASFRAWVDSAALPGRSEDDDDAVLWVLREMQVVAWDAWLLETCEGPDEAATYREELASVAALMKAFPHVDPEDFDRRAEQSWRESTDDEPPRYWADFHNEVCDALDEQSRREDWRVRLRKCLEARQRDGLSLDVE